MIGSTATIVPSSSTVEPREIIAHVRALARVRRAEQKFRSLVESAPHAMVITNQGGDIVLVNQRAEQLFGYSRQELLGQTVDVLVPERFRQFHPWHRSSYFAAPRPRDLGHGKALNARRKDGREFPVEISLSPLDTEDGMVVTAAIRDVSQRHKAEEAIRHLAAIVEYTDDAIFSKTLEGTITSWNAGAARTYGYAAAEVVGRPIQMLAPPERADEMFGILDHIRQGKRVEQFETVRVTKDGRKIQVSLSIFPVPDNQGKVSGACTIGRDITQRKLLEEQLRQSQKMDAIGRLAGGVAHDFNNLLSVINGYSELVLMRLGQEHPCREAIQMIRKSGERAASLTRQLLAFSRKQVLEPVVLDLNAILNELDKMLRRLIGEDIELVTALAPAIARIKADPGQIEQIVLNLAVNARDAMPQGGRLTIETGNVELDQAYAGVRNDVAPGSYVMLAVTDTGSGIPRDLQAHIFEPFFTTKEVGKGTGLGLATVYGIVKQSGGHIELYSEVARGTTFKIYFPRIAESTSPRRSRLSDVKIPQGTETVLLAEDEDGVRNLARFMLESAGYTVLEARSGPEALRIAQQHVGPIHLLVSDVVMPQMSGRQVANMLAPLHQGALFVRLYRRRRSCVTASWRTVQPS